MRRGRAGAERCGPRRIAPAELVDEPAPLVALELERPGEELGYLVAPALVAQGRAPALEELGVQPGAREPPVALDGRRRDVQAERDLVDVEIGEVAHLDDPRLPRMALGESGERAVEVEDLDVPDRVEIDLRRGAGGALRFWAWRARKWSTSTRRIMPAASPKKWLRSRQSTPRWSTRRRNASWTRAVVCSVWSGRSRRSCEAAIRLSSW